MSIDGQRWAVAGAAGSIGSALRAALHARGVELVSLDIAAVTSLGSTDRVAQADVADLETLTELFAGCAGVIHLGGIPDEADFHDIAEVNIVGTYHVLEAARRAGVHRVVFASSNRLTGMYDISTEVTVDMVPRPDTFYGVSKVAGEALCSLYSDKFGLSTIALRIGSYLDHPTSAREQRTWLSPDDAILAFLAAMTTPQHHGVFYAVSDNTGRWWNAESGAALGFHPRDDASRHTPLEPLAPGTAQSGAYAEAAYSVERMRR